ncbi:phenazine biosynthesis / PhzF family protein [Synechococcus sp. BIOS-E4-1]|uniref:PhzF family phenazine biosynthesis protein n=1 Tax=Synechococcus sp. BIOS-E4-1 TaxID=1400864 RepID=UPI001647AFD5|nr:PhzF family phenazine biosynthesis protein [Synechococcus sp. BIOS-E4-1]QNI53830.1 phenazine biosynthesis / PhzF family protein [Synechococcus sp. BIOS-E4-1]
MTGSIPIEQVAAFAEGPFQGNPAAVCPLQTWLPDRLMQAIASENNLSETAFYVGSEGHYDLRWFTPTCEVDLCGHATLAAGHVVFQREPDLEIVQFSSNSGPLTVRRNGSQLTLDFPLQPGKACAAPTGLNRILGISAIACLQAVDLMVVVADEREVEAIKPDSKAVAALPGRGLIVTAPGSDVDFVSRFFAPSCGIEEDPVTGSAHCTLAPYWAGRLGRSSLVARQLSARGGLLHCALTDERVLISGRVIPYLSGVIHIDKSCVDPLSNDELPSTST